MRSNAAREGQGQRINLFFGIGAVLIILAAIAIVVLVGLVVIGALQHH